MEDPLSLINFSASDFVEHIDHTYACQNTEKNQKILALEEENKELKISMIKFKRLCGYYKKKYEEVIKGENIPYDLRENVIKKAVSDPRLEGQFSTRQLKILIGKRKKAKQQKTFKISRKIRCLTPKAIKLLKKEQFLSLLQKPKETIKS